MADLYRCSPRKIKQYVTECLYAGLVPYVQSSPGMGKSTIMKNVANELQLKMIDHRLSTSAPEDLSGLPEFYNTKEGHRMAHFVPFADLFPIEGTEKPEGMEGWMLFLDEFNAAPKSVQAAAYKLILDKMVGQHKLHENVVLTAAGNLSTDRAITNPISTAMQSRVIHLEMEINFEEWLMDVAIPENYDTRIIAYLSQFPSKLMDFRPEHNEKTFCCPRTWEFTNRLIRNKEVKDATATLLAGTITSGVAVDFTQFTRVFHNLVTINEIRADPSNCRIPQDVGSKWAIISHMMEKITEDNFDDLSVYADRFSVDFRILFYRFTLKRKPELRQHPVFIRAMSTLSRYLNT